MRKLLGHRFRRSTLVAVFCAGVLAGIGMSRIISFEAAWIVVSILLLAVFVRHRRMAVVVLAILVGVCFGGWRGSVHMDKLALYQPLYDQKVTLIGTAGGDGTYGRGKQLSFDLKNAVVAGGSSEKLVGKVGVSGFGENMVFRGDKIAVTGKLRPGTGAHQGWMSYGQIQLVERETAVIEKVRREFAAGMMTALPEPLASFGMGLLIGQRSTLPDSVYNDLLMVGLVHIIAVSGYNLTIILRACWRLLGNRSKYQTMAVSITLIGTFLLITGASASIVRASLVSGLSLLAWYYGRNFKPVTLILLAAAITAMASPLFVWTDLGWYLSFLAFYGVLVLAPQVRYRLIPERFRNSFLLVIALESLCAEVMTLPLILYIFGQHSYISLVANVVIATFVPFAMLLAVLAGIAGTFFASVAGWFSWPATWLLTYMLDMARLLAGIPGVFVENIGFGLTAMVCMYGVIAFINVVLYSRLRGNRAIINAIREEHTLLSTSQMHAAPIR